MKRDNYKTKQREHILNIITSYKEEFTIKDIYSKLNDNASLTTIYRLIDKLVDDGIIIKNVHMDNSIHYQYLEKCNHDNHFFLKCLSCGSMIHVDCDCIDELYNHINNEHKFLLDKKHIIINGICYKCSNEGKVL